MRAHCRRHSKRLPIVPETRSRSLTAGPRNRNQARPAIPVPGHAGVHSHARQPRMPPVLARTLTGPGNSGPHSARSSKHLLRWTPASGVPQIPGPDTVRAPILRQVSTRKRILETTPRDLDAPRQWQMLATCRQRWCLKWHTVNPPRMATLSRLCTATASGSLDVPLGIERQPDRPVLGRRQKGG